MMTQDSRPAMAELVPPVRSQPGELNDHLNRVSDIQTIFSSFHRLVQLSWSRKTLSYL